MFGFEFQTNNVFVGGTCPERHVAFRSTSELMTLEADEGHLQNGSTDLEFVTSPAADLASAHKAVGEAVALAGLLAKRASTQDARVRIKKGPDAEAGGTWLRDCEIVVMDPGFRSATQGTVGHALANLPTLFETAFTRMGEKEPELPPLWQKIAQDTAACLNGSSNSSSLKGFLVAALAFAARATAPPEGAQVYDIRGQMNALPAGNRLFDFSTDPYVTRLGIFNCWSDRHWVVVSADGPKVSFPLLHRTDFHHMFRSLDAPDQEHVRSLVRTGRPWQLRGIQDAATTFLFPYPYRIEEEADDAGQRLDPGLLRLLPEVSATESAETWRIAVHGPSLQEWWTSVINGDVRRNGLAKDVASPPPGWRGRAPQSVEGFPANEDKSTYYGMGAFPMDSSAKPPLAVFEHRFLYSDPGMPAPYPTVEHWQEVVEFFFKHYVSL